MGNFEILSIVILIVLTMTFMIVMLILVTTYLITLSDKKMPLINYKNDNSLENGNTKVTSSNGISVGSTPDNNEKGLKSTDS